MANRKLQALGIAVTLTFLIATVAMSAWLLMIALGSLGHIFNNYTLATISFWEAGVVVFAVGLIGSFVGK